MRRVLLPLGLGVASIGCALGLLTLALMLLPDLLIGRTDYYTRFQRNQRMSLTWKPSDGDVFVAMSGRVRPVADDAPYAAFELAWDADGFRLAQTPQLSAPIAVFGDSFTEGFNVAAPYPDRLADLMGVGVQNYGFRAYGPREVARAAGEFLPRQPRRWVVWGFFAGNDLGDAMRPPRIDASTPWAAWSAFAARFAPPAPTASPRLTPDGQPQYDYPVPVIIGGAYYELAFVPYYWFWQQAPANGTFAASRNYAVIMQALADLETAAGAACRAVVFIPTKEQLYLPYVHPDVRQFLLNINERPHLLPDGALTYEAAPIAPDEAEAWFAQLSAQRDALRQLTEGRAGWRFIDLTPAFVEAVGRGELLYYPYDTHWNQAGHDLAAQVIAEALRAAPECL